MWLYVGQDEFKNLNILSNQLTPSRQKLLSLDFEQKTKPKPEMVPSRHDHLRKLELSLV